MVFTTTCIEVLVNSQLFSGSDIKRYKDIPKILKKCNEINNKQLGWGQLKSS